MCRNDGTEAFFGGRAPPVARGQGGYVYRVIDLVRMKRYQYGEEDMGVTVAEDDIPAACLKEAEHYRHLMLERICDFDEELMHQLLEDKQPDQAIVKRAIRTAVLAGKSTRLVRVLV